MTRARIAAWRRELRRAVLVRRRLLAALLAALAVVLAVQAARAEPETRPVVVAAGDLAAGEVLSTGDLETVEMAAALVPDGAVDPASPPVGRTVAGPIRAGEPLTDVRLVQPGLLAGFEPGTVLTTIRVDDPAAAALVRPGDRVDVIGSDPRARGATEVVASGVTVVSRTRAGAEPGLGDGAALVVAADRETALALTDAAVRRQLTVLIV